MLRPLIAAIFPVLCLASVLLPDLDDVIPRSLWAADAGIIPSMGTLNSSAPVNGQ